MADPRQLTPCLLDAFVASRPRARARSVNHLVGILGYFLDWAVTRQHLKAPPLRRTRRRETASRVPFLFNTAQARQLLEAAAALPDHAGSAKDPAACDGEVLPRLAWMAGAPRQNGACRERAP